LSIALGIKLYFGVSQRHSSSSPEETKAEMTTKIREELMEEMRKEIDRMRLELRQEFLSQQVCAELIQPFFSPLPRAQSGVVRLLQHQGRISLGRRGNVSYW